MSTCIIALDVHALQEPAKASHLGVFMSSLIILFSFIYFRYGYHCSNNSYYLCLHPPTMKGIFERIQTYENGQYPSSCGQYKIKSIRDLNTGYDSNQPDNKAVSELVNEKHILAIKKLLPPKGVGELLG